MKNEVEMMKNNGDFWETHGGFVREMNRPDNEQLEKFKGKLKSFKNCPFCANHAIFATELSREQVARASHQNTQDKNFEKFI